MKITKFGHCCLLIEEQGVRILTDPGSYTTAQNELKNIDLVLITHEHQDHFHVESVKQLIANNPSAVVVTNTAVGKILDKEGISHQIVDGTTQATIKNILIEACDHAHAVIYEDYGQVQNTGYMLANKFYIPGDAFSNPGKPVEILALPAGGPWMKISEAIDYAKQIKPGSCFPIHDTMYGANGGFVAMLIQNFLGKAGIKFVPIEINQEMEF